jgi:hypothetical protein
MISLICIENATLSDYALSDQNGHRYGVVTKNGYYYFKLIYSAQTQTQYTFQGTNASFFIWLGTDGQIARITANNQVYLWILSASKSPPNNINPVCNYSGVITPGGTNSLIQLINNPNNKLRITPINNIFARAIVPVIQHNFDLSYGS